MEIREESLKKKSKEDLIRIIIALREMINARDKRDRARLFANIEQMKKANDDCEKAYREIIRFFRG
jgi:hypothetical protein